MPGLDPALTKPLVADTPPDIEGTAIKGPDAGDISRARLRAEERRERRKVLEPLAGGTERVDEHDSRICVELVSDQERRDGAMQQLVAD